MLGLGNILTKGGALLGFPNKYSFNFDGSNDYLVTDKISLDFTNISVSMWVYANSFTSDDAFFAIADTDSNDEEMLFYNLSADSNKFSVFFASGSSVSTSSYAIPTGQWVHLALTKSGTALKLYANGSEVFSGSYTNTNTYSRNIFIGARKDSSYGLYLDGLIDEVAIWNTALSASDVAKIGSKPVDLTKYSASNLKLWLRAGDKVLPEEDTSIARSDFYTDFDGGSEYVVIPDINMSAFTEYWSFSMWFNADTVSGNQYLLTGAIDSSNIWGIRTTSTTIGITNYVAGRGTYVSKTGTFSAGSWTHIVGIINGGISDLKFYINGEEQSGTTNLDSLSNNTNIGIGSRSDTSAVSPYNGQLSSVALYQTALDPQTIKQLSKSRFLPQRQAMFSVVDFDGSNDYIDCGDINEIDGASALSISAWIKCDATSGNHIILSKYSSLTSRVEFLVSSNFLFVAVPDGSTMQGSVSFTDTGWNHVTMVFDGSGTGNAGRLKIYLNGVNQTLSYNGTIPSALPDIGSNVVTIGGRSGSSSLGFNGGMGQVSIYNTAKSADEVYAQYQKGITHNPSADTGLVGLWRMGDDTSKAYPTIADSSSNSNDGTITNGASDDIQQQAAAMYDMGAYDNSTEELGGEVVNDPTFSTDLANGGTNANFKLNGVGEITSGGWSFTAGGGVGRNTIMVDASTEATFLSSKLYKLIFTISSSGNALINWDWASSGYENYANGEHTVYAFGDGGNLQLQASGSGNDFSITALSIKPVIQSADLSDTYPAIIDVANPTLGAELVTNGSFESDGTGWTNIGSPTTSEINTDLAYVRTGTKSWKIVADGDDDGIYQLISQTAGKIYYVEAYVYIVSGAVELFNNGASIATTSTTGSFQKLSGYYSFGSNTTLTVRSFNTGGTFYIDDVSVKKIQGNVGTMTSMATDNLTYSSVLPDQSFLATGVNSAYNFIDLDGSNEYIQLTGNSPSGDFTISAWVKPERHGGAFNGIYTMWSGTNLWFGFKSHNSTGFLRIHTNAESNKEDTADGTLANNVWQQVAVTLSGSTVKLFINGESKTLTNSAGTMGGVTSASNPVIGGLSTNPTSNPLDGGISNIAVWDKALSDDAILDIYNGNRHYNLLDSYSDNMISYHTMGLLDASTGLSDSISTIYDRSGNSNHGTPTNADAGDLKSSPNAEPNGYAKGDTNRSTTKP